MILHNATIQHISIGPHGGNVVDISMKTFFLYENVLTHKQMEIQGRVISTVTTDALVLKHQAISIHSDD